MPANFSQCVRRFGSPVIEVSQTALPIAAAKRPQRAPDRTV